MENLILKSTLQESQRKLTLETEQDNSRGVITSSVFVEGKLSEQVEFPQPEKFSAEEVRQLLEKTHGDHKLELENLIEIFQRVVRLGSPEMMQQVATVLFYRGFYSQAEELFGVVSKINPNDHQTLNHLGMVFTATERYPQAIEFAEKAVSLCPEYADYVNNLGNSFLLNGNSREAISRFEQAIKINLYYGDAYYNLGLALVYNAVIQQVTEFFPNVVSRSTELFRKAIMTVPEYSTGLLEEGVLLLNETNFEEAFKKLLANRDKVIGWRRRNQAGLHMKFVMHPDWKNEELVRERLEVLKDQVSQNPDYADIYPELSLCYLEMARMNCKQAVESYTKAVELNPRLEKLGEHQKDSEMMYDNLCRNIKKISGKG